MAAPKDLKYTKTHEWVRVEGDTVILGITDAAQTELGDITYLELPEAGDPVTSGEPFGVVESVKAASDVYSPVDGEVVERNDEAIDSPELINQSPYEKAWLLKVKLSDPTQLDALLSNADYDSYAEENLG
ncbi:MAG TPA: glycine cleavage system protein GcvH [Thermomicrobiales bacterium]|nr:glycine cleavage system protein GcvH [Thermomicrobiales bacterium]